MRRLNACWFSVGLLLLLKVPAANAAGIVGSGTAASCTETAFNTALIGGGAVTFDCGPIPVTITFTSQKAITTSTNIDGGGLVSLSGGDAVRLFEVTGGATLGIADLVLVDGHTTAANENGAAIRANPGTLVISRSTIASHQVDQGGCGAIGMFNGSSLSMDSSTVSGNFSSSQGGAMCLFNTDADIVNSTISGNSAGGGGGIDAGSSTTPRTVSIRSSTIANNTSNNANQALQASGTTTVVRLRNTIVANNPGGNCDLSLSAQILDDGNNLQYPSSATTCGATIPVLDPLLGPLASNGGPTQTMALPFGSPAVDQGDDAACPLVDQRGQSRFDGDLDNVVSCDIGAYELGELPTVVVPTLGEWGLLALALVLAVAALLGLGQRHAKARMEVRKR